MAKRFGRNQKRNLRETIGSLQATVSEKKDYIVHQRASIGYWSGLYKDVAESIQRYCDHHVTLPPTEVIHVVQDHKFALHKLETMPDLRRMGDDPAVAMEVHDVLMYVIDVIGRYDEFSDAIHVRVQSPGKPWAYAISGKDIDHAHDIAHFVKFASEMITRALVETMEERRVKKLR